MPRKQAGIPAADLQIESGTSTPSGDLSGDASGNIYISGNSCTQGESNTGTPTINRLNVPTETVYTVVAANAYPYGGTATAGYNAFYAYDIAPVSAIPDNAGNLFFTTYNQIATLQATAAAEDFGGLNDYQTSAAKPVTYANVGNATGPAPPYSFSSGANFKVLDGSDANACDVLANLAPGASCDLNLAFAPIAVGALSDTLNVDLGALTVKTTGVGVAAPAFGISPATLAFGNQTVKTTSAPQYFTLTDTGTANLIISSAFPDGTNGFADYAVANGGTCPTGSFTLTPQQSCTIAITFTPQTAASLPANFYVGDSVNFGDVATLSGTGTPAVTPAPVAALTASLAFPNTAQGKLTSAMNATLSNTGNASLTVTRDYARRHQRC